MVRTLMLVVLVACACQVQAADLDKWRDAGGRVYYSDQPPPPNAMSVERKSAKGNLIESDTIPYETQQVARK